MLKFLTTVTALIAATTTAAPAGIYFVGPKADVAAVQAAEHKIAPSHNNVIGVHVIGDYALLLFWSGSTFAPNLEKHDAFKRSSGERWTRIYTGSDACNQLARRGVPPAIATRLCSGWGDVGS
jgi:hypothetical protein